MMTIHHSTNNGVTTACGTNVSGLQASRVWRGVTCKRCIELGIRQPSVAIDAPAIVLEAMGLPDWLEAAYAPNIIRRYATHIPTNADAEAYFRQVHDLTGEALRERMPVGWQPTHVALVDKAPDPNCVIGPPARAASSQPRDCGDPLCFVCYPLTAFGNTTVCAMVDKAPDPDCTIEFVTPGPEHQHTLDSCVRCGAPLRAQLMGARVCSRGC